MQGEKTLKIKCSEVQLQIAFDQMNYFSCIIEEERKGLIQIKWKL